MKKLFLLLIPISIWGFFSLIHNSVEAVDPDFTYSYEGIPSSGAYGMNFTDNDYEISIASAQYNAGDGWIDNPDAVGAPVSVIYVDYQDLPNEPTMILYRIWTDDGSVYFDESLYVGRAVGCDRGVDCPTGDAVPYAPETEVGEPPVYVNSAVTTPGTNSTSTITYETTGSDNILVAMAYYDIFPENSLSSVTWDGIEMQQGCLARSFNSVVEFYYLDEEAGAYEADVVFTFPGNANDLVTGVVEFEGVNTDDPIGNFLCNDDGGAWAYDHSITVGSNEGSIVLGGVVSYSGGGNIQSADADGMTALWESIYTNTSYSAAYKSGESSTELAWTGPSEWPTSAFAVSVNGIGGVAGLDDTTNPTITFDSTPGANSLADFTITGTANEDSSLIQTVNAYYYNETTSSTLTRVYGSADDGVFNSTSEDFTLSFSGLEGGDYNIAVIVTNEYGFETRYYYSTEVSSDDTGPVISVENLGQAPMTDTTPTFTGSAIDSENPIASVQYSVYNGSGDEVSLTNAVADDGAFDELSETFTFTTPSLTDGAKLITVEATDTIGNTTSFVVDRIVIDAVDSSEPIVSLKAVSPDPLVDPLPKVQGQVIDNRNDATSNIAALYYKVDSDVSWTSFDPADGVLNDEIEENFTLSISGLATGEHTVYIRAVDAAGNDTDAEGTNGEVTFDLIDQPGSLEPIEVSTDVEFTSRSYYDFTSEDVVWGDGRLRLAEEMTPSNEVIIPNDSDLFGPRYASYGGSKQYAMDESSQGGFWVAKNAGFFSYYDTDTDTEYNFDIDDYWGSSGHEAYDLQEIVSDGEIHLWIASWNGIVAINFGSSITDGSGDSYTYRINPSVVTGTNLLAIDARDSSNYGVYYDQSNAINYIEKPTFNNGSSSATLTQRFDGIGSQYNVADTTAMYMDGENNLLYIGEYVQGVTIIDDAGDPTNTANDSATTYATQVGVFDIGLDQDGIPYLVGNRGIEVITDDGGTYLDSADDTVTQVASTADFNIDVGAQVIYMPGDEYNPNQFYVTNRSGSMFYLATNGTYADTGDDQIIPMVFTNVYPAAIKDMYLEDEDTLIVSVERVGVIRYTVNRQYVEDGFAQTVIDPQISTYLDADYFVLDSVTRVDTSNAVATYEVSNDGGETWQEIEIGEKFNFPTDDYRITLRISLFRGSTPVITGFSMSYAAYPDASAKELNSYSITVPTSVNSGAAFSFDIDALDQLENTYEEDFTVAIQLRRSSDNQLINTFNVSSADLVDGSATVSNAIANVVGNHYITVSGNSVSTNSSAITFIGSDDSNSGGNTGNNSNNVGNSGSTEEEDETETEEAGSAPEIIEFTVKEEIVNGRKQVTITWKVENADNVEISNIGSNLALEGTYTYFADNDEDLVIQIVATNEFGEVFANETVTAIEPDDDNEDSINVNSESTSGSSSSFKVEDIVLATEVLLVSSALLIGLSDAGIKGFIGVLFGALILRKKKYWGIVYDSVESKPIPFATIRIYNENGKFEQQTVTDFEGRYGFILDSTGTKTMEVKAVGFKPFETSVQVTSSKEVVQDVGMLPNSASADSIKSKLGRRKIELYKLVNVVFIILSILGLIYTIQATSSNPVTLNYLILLGYFIVFIVNAILWINEIRKKAGGVVDSNRRGVPSARIRLSTNEKAIGITLTNKEGKYKINAKSGMYVANVYKEGYEHLPNANLKLDNSGKATQDIVLNRE